MRQCWHGTGRPGIRVFNAALGITSQAWSPIGGITFYRDTDGASTLDDPAIRGISKTHGKSPAQVMLRWHLQRGRGPDPAAITLESFGWEIPEA